MATYLWNQFCFTEPASWVKEPENQEVLEGANVVLQCVATGLPVPNIIWIKQNSKTLKHLNIYTQFFAYYFFIVN